MQRIVIGALAREGEVLLALRGPDRAAASGQWDLPGGHVEAGEFGLETLERELREELGVLIATDSAQHLLTWSGGAGPEGVVFDAWLVRAWQGTPINAAPEEHDEVRWFRAESMPPLAHEGLRTLLMDAIALQ